MYRQHLTSLVQRSVAERWSRALYSGLLRNIFPVVLVIKDAFRVLCVLEWSLVDGKGKWQGHGSSEVGEEKNTRQFVDKSHGVKAIPRRAEAILYIYLVF